MLVIQRNFTKYDDSDEIKRLSDSDILAAKKKSNLSSYVKAARDLITSGAIGAVSGTALTMILSKKLGISVKEAAKVGALVGSTSGAAIGTVRSLKKSEEERESNRRYNKRLDEAKYQADRREKKDWQNQLTGRDNYSY